MDWDRDYANYVDDKGVAELQAPEKELGKCINSFQKLEIYDFNLIIFRI